MDWNTLVLGGSLGGSLAVVTAAFIMQRAQMHSQRRQHLHEKAELERKLRFARMTASLADTDKRAALDRAERAEAAITVHRLHTISASSQAPRPRYDRPTTVYQASPARTSHARDDDHTEFGPVFSLHRDDDDSRSCGSCGDSCSSDSSSSDSGSSDSGSCSSSGD